MALNQQTSNLITTTINAFNGEVASISPLDGISLIDSWTSALRDTDQSANPVASSLGELKSELQSGNPDGNRIQQLLTEMTDEARAAADSADTDVKTRLNALIEALDGFGRQLSGSVERGDRSGQQAPMTSTVGGESTTSGAGASAFRTNTDDDLSNRTGGVTSVTTGADELVSGMDDPTGSDGGSGGMDPDGGDLSGIGNNVSRNDSAMGMEDFTGAEGAQQQDGGSYGSGYGTGSQGDDYSANSGTQRSGVSGPSTSGGAAESGGSSSGGRSQY